MSVAFHDICPVPEESAGVVPRFWAEVSLGRGSKIPRANGFLPKGQRLVVGENMTILL